MNMMKSERLAGIIKSCLYWNMNLMTTYLHDTNWSDENSSVIITLIKIYQWNENWSIWLSFINLMKINSYDDYSTLWWKLIEVMKIYYGDKNSSPWWKFIAVMKMSCCTKSLLLWWKFIIARNIYHWEMIVENLSTRWKLYLQ